MLFAGGGGKNLQFRHWAKKWKIMAVELTSITSDCRWDLVDRLTAASTPPRTTVNCFPCRLVSTHAREQCRHCRHNFYTDNDNNTQSHTHTHTSAWTFTNIERRWMWLSGNIRDDRRGDRSRNSFAE